MRVEAAKTHERPVVSTCGQQHEHMAGGAYAPLELKRCFLRHGGCSCHELVQRALSGPTDVLQLSQRQILLVMAGTLRGLVA